MRLSPFSVPNMRAKGARYVLIALVLVATLLSMSKVSPSLAQRPFLKNLQPFPNANGTLETYSTTGDIALTGPFFQSLGTNGRSCVSCHQPDQAWTISAAAVQQRFDQTQGTDPIFRTNDGSNCDHNVDVSTVDGRRQAYSLLTSRGLLRIAINVPADAEFVVDNVINPYGCNETGVLSMYRRPLPASNLRFLSAVMWDGRESSPQTGTQKITYESQNPGSILIADLAHQSVDATLGHAQALVPPTPDQQSAIVNFELALFTAQSHDVNAGKLDGNGVQAGPVSLAGQLFFVGINDPIDPLNGSLSRPDLGFNPFHSGFTPVVSTLYDSWSNPQPPNSAVSKARASIARGQALFNSKTINITGVSGLNDELGFSMIPGTCGTCHDTPNVGNHSFPTPLDIGVSDLTSPLDVTYLPLITLRHTTAPYEIVQTTDPGRALVTGKWKDIGRLKGPILRGLAARAPYFHNGSASNLGDVLDFYDKRFGINFTVQEKADLIAFLNAL
jgi:cytochrome c peroxidase